MPAPRQVVDPPTFTPSPNGLLTVAQQPPTDGSPHWQHGVTWQSRCLNPFGATTYDECIAVTGTGAPPPPATKTDNFENEIRGATPFTVVAKFDCSPVGMPDVLKIARDALAQTEPWQVERAFWTGVAGGRAIVYPHLAANAEVTAADGAVLQVTATPVVTGATGLEVDVALGLLEQALADCYGGVGVIHIPVKALPEFGGHVVARGAQLFTRNGNAVAVGAGYPGTSPTGVAPPTDHSWIYATGPVFLYRSDVQVLNETFNRSENTQEGIAERTYVIGFDCCLHAAYVRLADPATA